jgi:type III secretion protein S
MGYDDLLELTSQALVMCAILSMPAVVVSAVVGLLVSFVQAVTSLQDSSVSQGLKLIAVTMVVFIAAPWAGATLLHFAESLFNAVFE